MDLRYPVGMLFLALGALLAGYGVLAPARPQASLPFNVNLIWGLAMLVFGALMFFGARGRRKHQP
jgi:uncharacterized membrane protein HdeD (DUF308 family)